MEFTIKCSAFEHGAMIPKKYTCDGINISPSLSWNSAPQGTKSFAIISDDPDAPMGTWVHWVIFNIPHNITELSENIHPQKTIENNISQGTNDFRCVG